MEIKYVQFRIRCELNRLCNKDTCLGGCVDNILEKAREEVML